MAFLLSIRDGAAHLKFPLADSCALGRSSECEIQLIDTELSRKHARIERREDGYAIEDLGSRNGTYLSGERVGNRVTAREGSRIQVGASIFLVRLNEKPQEIDLAETGTLAFDEATAQRQDMDGGELSNIGVLELLHGMFNAQRNATIHVAMPDDQHAQVEVRNGEVYAADYAGLKGFNALVKLGRGTGGIFWLVETEGSCLRNIHEHGARLIADLARCLDPAAAPRAR